MPDSVSAWIFHLTPVLMMMGVIFVNHAVTHQRTERRGDVEASRFRAALAAEMRALLDLYETNLDFLARGGEIVLSARQLMPVYKGNLGRLTIVLEEEVLAPVVAMFAYIEKIEAILSARTQPRNGSGYKVTPSDIDPDELKGLFETAARQANAACELLENRMRAVALVRTTALRPASRAALNAAVTSH